MMKSVVVTGVSSGIGLGTVQVLLKQGFRVFGTVRKESDAARLRSELGPHFEAVLMDVLDEQSIRRASDEIAKKLGDERLFGLVNNAGIAFAAPLSLQNKKDFLAQMNVNLIGPFLVTQAFLPLLGIDPLRKGEPGRIVNISSVAGKMGAPFLGAYAATKHGLEGMSESLRRELALYGIKVIIVGPGSVKTPIWDKAEEQDISEFAGTDCEKSLNRFQNFIIQDGKKGLTPTDIGEIVSQALSDSNPKVRYAAVRGKLFNWILPNLLPRKWVDSIVTRNFGLMKKLP